MSKVPTQPDKNGRLSIQHHELATVLSYRLKKPIRSILAQALEEYAARFPQFANEYPDEFRSLYVGMDLGKLR
jgi:hypothetical protein